MRNRMSPELMKRKGDLLMDAGRLAAEYLVSQGRLPPAVLSGTRTSALARLGTTSRRRFSAEPVEAAAAATATATAPPPLPPPPPPAPAQAVDPEVEVEEVEEEEKEEETPAPQIGEFKMGKDIEVIDLEENESPVQTKAETEDGDGYGLMISELLEKDFQPQGVAAAVEEEQGVSLADDDSIYMSLGEIPLTYLRPPWEQPPPQDYDKPF